MKRVIIPVILLALLAVFAAGCGENAEPPENNTSAGSTTTASTPASSTPASTSSASEWPSDSLPDGTPEYTGGKIVNTGGSDDNFVILVEGSKEMIDAYLAQLESAGYGVDDTTAKKGGVTIDISDRGNGTWQIGVITLAAAGWPDTIPSFITMPAGKSLAGDPYLDDMGSLVNLSVDINDMSEEEGIAWFNEMAATWIDGGNDGTQWTGDVEHNGKTWTVSAEIYEVSGGVFSAQFSWYEK